jgi:hypothetical protein
MDQAPNQQNKKQESILEIGLVEYTIKSILAEVHHIIITDNEHLSNGNILLTIEIYLTSVQANECPKTRLRSSFKAYYLSLLA